MMAGENKEGSVVIEVVLDDGSTKQYFGRLKKDAADASKEASKELGKVSNTVDGSSLDDFKAGLSDVAKRYALVGVAATAAAAVVKSAFDAAIAGEAATAAEKVFDRIANSQGLTGLRDQLEAAADGLLDVGDIAQRAASSVINLGDSASRLPDLLNLATKSALQFGGTAEDRFFGLIQAVETGNTRILRQQGIIVDANRVMDQYARTLGLTASELTQAQRQQALLNAVLEDGEKRLSAAGENVAPLQTSVTRLNVAVNEFSESIQKSISSSVGPFFASILNGITSVITAANQYSNAASRAMDVPINQASAFRAQIIGTEARLESLRKKFAELREEGGFLSQFKIGFVGREIAILTQRLEIARKKYAELGATARNVTPADANPNPAGSLAETTKLTAEQVEAIRSRNLQIQQLQLQATEQALAVEQARILKISDLDQQELQRKSLYGQQLILLGQQQAIAEQQAQLQYNSQKGFTEEQSQQAILAIRERYAALLAQKDMENMGRIERDNITILESYQNLSRGVSDSLFELRQNAEVNFRAAGKAAVQGLGNSVGSAFNAYGAALAKGEDATKAFSDAFLRSIGGMITQLGQSYILQGIAASVNPLTPGAGAGLIAAGIALSTFGGVLGGTGGGSSAGPAAGAAGGEPVQVQPVDQVVAEEPGQKTAQVQVVIQGDVLDSDETGLRIAEILNQAYDKQGVVVKQGVIA